MTFEEGLKMLQTTFRDYIKTQVISQVNIENLGNRIFIIIFVNFLKIYRRNFFYWTSSTKISRFRKNDSKCVEW